MKKHILSILLFIAIASPVLLVSNMVKADAPIFTPDRYLQAINESKDGKGGTGLIGFDKQAHSEATVDSGTQEITSAIFAVTDFIKYGMGAIAVMLIVIAAIKMITANGDQIQEVLEKQKPNLKYSFMGLLIIILSDTLVRKMFFGEYGDALTSEATVQIYGEQSSAQFKGIYNFFEYFAGAIAVLMIVKSGFVMVVMPTNEDTMSKQKRHIGYAAGGLILIGVAEFVVKDILFPDMGARITDTEKAKMLILNFVNFLTSFIGTISLVACFYAGYLYVMGATNEENTGKAKKVITGAVIGILIAAGAYAIVHTVITLEPPAQSLQQINELPGTIGNPTVNPTTPKIP